MIGAIGFPPVTIAIFLCLTLGLLFLDFSTHRKEAVVTLKSAVSWSLLYVAVSLAFAGYLGVYHGKESASLFLTGYALEKVLAFDNLFVFSMIFAYFKIPEEKQHAALYWGIAGAIVFRLLFVFIGVTSMNLIGPTVELVFAAIILYSVYLMWKAGEDEGADYNKMWIVRTVRKFYPQASVFFVVVCVIEVSDIMFSFDSVPAIIAITKDPLLIYTAMIFAILGLRSMYFIISALSKYFVCMDLAVRFVLLFIAGKLVASAGFGYHLDPLLSLAIILSMLVVGALSSVLYGENHENSGSVNKS